MSFRLLGGNIFNLYRSKRSNYLTIWKAYHDLENSSTLKEISFPLYFLFISEKKNLSDVSNCECGQLDKYHNPYSYCMRWFSSLPPLCFLRGGSSARHCPGARKLRGTETYLTSDEAICNASKGELQSLNETTTYNITYIP